MIRDASRPSLQTAQDVRTFQGVFTLHVRNSISEAVTSAFGDGTPQLERIAYSVADAATVSGLSRSRLYELFKTGELRSRKIAGRRLVMRADLLALLNPRVGQ